MTKYIKMKVSIASTDWSLVPGEVIPASDDLASAWIKCGHASEYKGQTEKLKHNHFYEKAMLGAFETPESSPATPPASNTDQTEETTETVTDAEETTQAETDTTQTELQV